MEEITISTEYIKLDQFLKWSGISENGAIAKIIISEGNVKVNGIVENKRGKKLRNGDKVEIENKVFSVKKE